MFIKLLVSALLLIQTSSFAATATMFNTDPLMATDYRSTHADTAKPVAEPETEEMILMGLSLMGVIAFRRKVNA
ncbi:PEP-CTERM sorting domain-containing protein [Methylophilus aquaticus]|uniref:PEP-CTERM sorting domain-containing protein n=1 Tax=Methylophilus aquaticus TaxID=1971610 RepID=A0ABT9JQH9_9PROT|nr:PEP-CTERM sorting domain-containing protein [Methylophilus aquaticus]MDP8566825.1 PEP-CTERM sorting domain-containing protein [Methylophilus aquaticus]